MNGSGLVYFGGPDEPGMC